MFTENDIPRMDGKVVVITGANSGIGFEASRMLAGRGAHVVMSCRDEGRMGGALTSLRAMVPDAKVDGLVLDLASLGSIERASNELANSHPHIDVLVNNAGVMAVPERTTVDGFELQFGTNHLGHFAFTGRILPLLDHVNGGRVVTVSSLLHRQGRIDFGAIPRPSKYDQGRQYSMSKLANLLFTYELERRFRKSSSTAIAIGCHPGYSSTNLQHVGPKMRGSLLQALMMRAMNALVAQPAAVGALATVMAATGDVRGGDYVGGARMNQLRGLPEILRSSPASYDHGTAERLWGVSETLTGVTYSFPT